MLKTLSIWICGHDLRKNSGGLGPNYWGYWRLLLPYSGRFYEPSITHDLWYSFGGNEKDREEADVLFYEECMDKCGKNVIAVICATIYFVLLRKFGYNNFNYKQK